MCDSLRRTAPTLYASNREARSLSLNGEANKQPSVGRNRERIGDANDRMEPSPTSEADADTNKKSRISEGGRPRGRSAAEWSARVASAGGAGDGEWSVQTVHIDPKRGSLPKLTGRRKGDGDGDKDSSSISGEPEDPRTSEKRRRSVRQRNSTQTPRIGEGPSSPASSTGGNERRRVGLGEREGGELASSRGWEGVRRGREATANDKDGAEEELEMSRAYLSPSSVSTSASVAARIEGEGGSVGSGRTRPPRLDL